MRNTRTNRASQGPRGSRPHTPPQAANVETMIRALHANGWNESLAVGEDGRISVAGRHVDAGHFVVEATYRYEGPTNPDDESLVLAVRHDPTNTRGVLVTAYGPNASASEARALKDLRDEA